MITWKTGDIFRSEAEVLVNPVNAVGVSGKGLAKEFAENFAAYDVSYRRACQRKEICVGTGMLVGSVFYFVTKDHWKNGSQLAYIEEGLRDFVRQMQIRRISSAAMPALGCGCGGLQWKDVERLLVKYLGPITMEVEVYLPLELSDAPLPVPVPRLRKSVREDRTHV